MKLIIAEKPSLARNIADAIGKSSRRDGYLEVGDYLVTWAFGHLFSLADVEDYPEYAPDGYAEGGKKKVKWTLERLPCFPTQFKYVLRDDATGGVSKQFSIIRTLC